MHQIIIESYSIPSEQPFPQEHIGGWASPLECIRALGIGLWDLKRGLRGEIISRQHDRIRIELAPDFILREAMDEVPAVSDVVRGVYIEEIIEIAISEIIAETRGMTDPEIAHFLGTTLRAVESVRFRTLKKLRTSKFREALIEKIQIDNSVNHVCEPRKL